MRSTSARRPWWSGSFDGSLVTSIGSAVGTEIEARRVIDRLLPMRSRASPHHARMLSKRLALRSLDHITKPRSDWLRTHGERDGRGLLRDIEALHTSLGNDVHRAGGTAGAGGGADGDSLDGGYKGNLGDSHFDVGRSRVTCDRMKGWRRRAA